MKALHRAKATTGCRSRNRRGHDGRAVILERELVALRVRDQDERIFSGMSARPAGGTVEIDGGGTKIASASVAATMKRRKPSMGEACRKISTPASVTCIGFRTTGCANSCSPRAARSAVDAQTRPERHACDLAISSRAITVAVRSKKPQSGRRTDQLAPVA
jgi:hypothetical protein